MKPFKFFFLFLLVFISCNINAQIGFHSDSTTSFDNQTINKNSSLLKYKRISFSLDMGFGFGGSKYNTGAYTYIAPYMSYMVTPRFKLDVGGMLQQGFNSFNNDEYQTFGGNGTNLLLFARGNYLVSDKLIISGAVYKTFDKNNNVNSELIDKKNSFDNYGISVGVDYKITENLTIGAQVNYSNGNNNSFSPTQSSPYGWYQPYNRRHNSPHTGFMGW